MVGVASKKLFTTVMIAVVFFLLGALYWEHFRPVNLYDTGISDEEYIRIAGQTLEARNFMEKYPDAAASVERSGSLAVDFRVEGEDEGHLRLRIFVNPRNHRPTGKKFIDCSGKLVRSDLTGYLERENCLG